MRITTFLMFTGRAEEAMNFYVQTFPRSRVVSVERYGPGEAGAAGSVKRATFELNGTELMCIDSPIEHAFTFTPSMSLFIDCDSRQQLDVAFNRLSDGGNVLMPPDDYGFSRWFAWVADRYGVTWQLNLPA
jgi:predicted 3-demethylubiquinone-9 3-methyltransferase (glyoxalase superfamily)